MQRPEFDVLRLYSCNLTNFRPLILAHVLYGTVEAIGSSVDLAVQYRVIIVRVTCPDTPRKRHTEILMGFLGIATPLPWEDSKQYLKYVREHGVKQFINMYLRLKVLAAHPGVDSHPFSEGLLWRPQVWRRGRVHSVPTRSRVEACTSLSPW